ncbi:MAG TPA: glycosyltransferase family 2 protein [Candidatus Saccharimonadales bacterium]|nr:glycosyltransferase family 2 protein [Candidatus Saccharimonadales bacterium]
MNRLSVCLIAQNEEENLPRVLNSVAGVADEVVVVDGGSGDRTGEVAREHGAKLFYRAFTNHADQKNYAASLATNDWILLLDADEELSEDLKGSLLEWKTRAAECAVYEMARLTWYLGAWIHHSRWYPDYQRRLYRRDKTKFDGVIHSALDFKGRIGRLRGDLLHYTIRTFPEHEAKVEKYTTEIAKEMYERGERGWRGALWVATPWSWFRHYVLGAGFMDGYRGALIAKMAARGVRLKYQKLGKLVEAEKKTGGGEA